jgi:hypothetical protein
MTNVQGTANGGKEVVRASLLTFLSRNKKVRRLAGRNPPVFVTVHYE